MLEMDTQRSELADDVLYTGRVELAGGVLNVRDTPGGLIIGTLSPGERVEVTDDTGEWAEIIFGNVPGYVSKRYICFERAKQNVKIVVENDEGHVMTASGTVTIRVAAGAID